MTKRTKIEKKNLNITTISCNAEKYIRNHPIYSAMYKDELLAKDLEEQRMNRRNGNSKIK